MNDYTETKLGLYPAPRDAWLLDSTDSPERGFPEQALIPLKFIRKLLKHLIWNTNFFSEWVVNFIIHQVLSQNGPRAIFLLHCFSVLREAGGCLGMCFFLWFSFHFSLLPMLPSVSLTSPQVSAPCWWCSIWEVHSSNRNNSSNKILYCDYYTTDVLNAIPIFTNLILTRPLWSRSCTHSTLVEVNEAQRS